MTVQELVKVLQSLEDNQETEVLVQERGAIYQRLLLVRVRQILFRSGSGTSVCLVWEDWGEP